MFCSFFPTPSLLLKTKNKKKSQWTEELPHRLDFFPLLWVTEKKRDTNQIRQSNLTECWETGSWRRVKITQVYYLHQVCLELHLYALLHRHTHTHITQHLILLPGPLTVTVVSHRPRPVLLAVHGTIAQHRLLPGWSQHTESVMSQNKSATRRTSRQPRKRCRRTTSVSKFLWQRKINHVWQDVYVKIRTKEHQEWGSRRWPHLQVAQSCQKTRGARVVHANHTRLHGTMFG